MKITIICKSHTQGGAAVVSHRLMRALQEAGAEARMLVLSSPTTPPDVLNYSSRVATPAGFLAERLQIFLQNGLSKARLFKVDTASWGADLSGHPWVRDADVVMLNWLNQGAMSLRGVRRLCALPAKTVIWTMHDMWCCTGICHHAYGCRRYAGTCHHCPYLGFMAYGNDLSARTQRRKAALYATAGIHFVAVSHWLEQCCRQSSLMRDSAISVIANAFPVEQFGYEPEPLPCVPEGKTALVMGAARLDDEVKGFDTLIAATDCLRRDNPTLAGGLHLLFFGDIRRRELLRQLAISHTWLGRVSQSQVAGIYRSGAVVVSSSRYETLPGTIIEGMASGCAAVAFDAGGAGDIIDHLRTGYIARAGDAADLARGIAWAATQSACTRAELHRQMQQRFGAASIARQYLELIARLRQPPR